MLTAKLMHPLQMTFSVPRKRGVWKNTASPFLLIQDKIYPVSSSLPMQKGVQV